MDQEQPTINVTTFEHLIQTADRVFRCGECGTVMMTGDGAILHENVRHQGRTTMRPVRWCVQHQRFHGLDAADTTIDDLAGS